VLVSASPQTTEVVHAFARPLAIAVTDAFGNPARDVQVAFAAPSAPGAQLSAATATTDATGTAYVLAIADATIGSYVVTASTSGMSDATFALSNSPAGPSAIAFTSGGLQSTLATTAFAAPIHAHVVDAYGNPVGAAAVTWMASGVPVTLTSTTSMTDANGDVAVSVSAGPVVGTATVSAQVPGAVGTASTTLDVQAIPTTTTASDASWSTADSSYAVAVTVTSNLGTPHGVVELYDTNGTLVGSGTLASGAASVKVQLLSNGVHDITAHYAAQGSYGESTSSATPLEVAYDSKWLSGCDAGGSSGGGLIALAIAALLRGRRRARPVR
jgi:hypothetical protein